MANQFAIAGASSEPSGFAPLHQNRMATGAWSNRNPLRDAASTRYEEQFYGGRQDALIGGNDVEISSRLTLRRRAGLTVYNTQTFPPIRRFYSFNTFTLTDEAVRVLADTTSVVYDATGPNTRDALFTKSAGAGPTYFLGVGNVLYMTNGVDNKQWDYDNDTIYNWGITAPVNAPTVSQMPRPNNYPAWTPNTAYGINTPALRGMLILDDTNAINTGNYGIIQLPGGGHLAIGCGQNLPSGQSIPLPSGDYSNARMQAWTTPGTGYTNTNIAGVYQSAANGGTVNSTFQNRSGGVAGTASNNWIAVAWDSAGAASVQVTNQGSVTTLIVATASGISVEFIFGSIYSGGTLPVNPGLQVLAIPGMASADPVNHNMQGIFTCNLTGTTVTGQYADQSGNSWHGNVNVFAVAWTAGQLTVEAVSNGSALVIPAGAGNTVSLTFSNALLNGASFGVPNTAIPTFTTAAMTGWTRAGVSNGFGWGVSVANLTVTARYRDTSNNNYEWDGYANAFAVSFNQSASSGSVQYFPGNGTTGPADPAWNSDAGETTQDGSVLWTSLGPCGWQANHYYSVGNVCLGIPVNPAGMPTQIYVCTTPGTSDPNNSPQWAGGPNIQVQDGGVVWTCAGHIMGWNDIGPNTDISSAVTILDSNAYTQGVTREGKSGAVEPTDWATDVGFTTADNTMLWLNTGGFSPAGTAAVQYGYAFMNPATLDESEMSPASIPITVYQGNQVTVQGDGPGDPADSQVVIFRTLQGGSTFGYLDTIPAPPPGQKWTYIDNSSDADVNMEIQAQVNGEGTPLPAGATCLAYHVGRIFAAVGNVVYISAGPDATPNASSGNAGFPITFTVQSKITRLWATSLGVIVFTVRDSYQIQGTGVQGDPALGINADPFTINTWIENLPLLNFDAFSVFLTTPYLLTGNRMVVALDPSAGVFEASFPVADWIAPLDPASSFVSFHSGPTGETALYVSDGATKWYRMAPTSSPESGLNWNPVANITGGCSAVQSIEINPGELALLLGPPAGEGGPILMRDPTVNTDNGTPYSARGRIGSLVVAYPGQLAGLYWITAESEKYGSKPAISVLLNEISGDFEEVPRSRQDPTNLPPSQSLYSDRYSLLQNQKPTWCRHLQFEVEWPPEDAPNELLTYTIFGEIWNEMRAQ